MFTITQDVSGLSHDIVLPMRSLEGECFIKAPSGMVWENSTEKEQSLTDKRALTLRSKSLTIRILITETDESSTIMHKYRVPGAEVLRIGRDPSCQICQDIDVLTGFHAEMSVKSPTECMFVDHSKNGSFINGQKIVGRNVILRFGDVVTLGLGLKIIFLGSMIAINKPPRLMHVKLPQLDALRYPQIDIQKAIEHDQTSSTIQYHRSPRILHQPDTTPIKIEPPIAKQANNALPLLMTLGPSATMILPMLLSSLITGNNATSMLIMIGGSSALSVMWGLVNANYRKKQGFLSEEKRIALYQQYIEDTEGKLMSMSEQEFARLNEQCLSIAQCLDLPTSSTHRLWERSPAHADFTSLRLGRGEVRLPSPISIPQEKLSMIDDPLCDEPSRLQSTYEKIANAPITMQVRKWPIIGMLGSQEHPRLLQSLVTQLAAMHSYHDVKIVILANEKHRSQWDWARWLPHVSANEERSMRLIAFTPDDIQDVLDHLCDVLLMRGELAGTDATVKRAGEDDSANQPLPHYVVFCADPSIMENQPFMRHLLARKLGFSMIMLANSMDLLPKECGLIIQASDQLGSIYTAQGDVTNVQFETADLPALRRFGHNIAPLRVKDSAESTFIPSMVPFMDLYHARNIDDIDVWRYWNENHAYEGLRSTIGLRTGSRPFILDISEKHHGPHGLVAGTTGSGKSVMLQTYILSLALNYHPRDVQFIIIDYKGGGMANVFRDLPHVAGMIDNLQGHSTINRALLSIQGEIHRREAIFKRLGVEKIDEYIRYYNNDPNEVPLAHLIIVVDEFAELKKEEPDFMRELISASRTGRALGVHLILATQKPSNSVDDEIWSNTRFRICLRVASRSDSNDMLKRPDAAYLKGMGRCYIQVGNDEIFEQVQTSYSGIEYAPAALAGDELPRRLDEVGRPIRVRKKSSAPKGAKKEKPVSQMDKVLERISQVMEERQLAPARPLWLMELKPVIMLESLPGFKNSIFDGTAWPVREAGAEPELMAYYAMIDDVYKQRHLPFAINYLTDHNIKIVGPASSGKTSLLQTIAVSLALRYTPEEVNMYIFSLTSHTLGKLSAMPHVGTIVFEDDDNEILQLLNLIVEENKRRAKLFAQHSTDSFTQFNKSARESGGQIEVLPAIIVMIDRFKSLLDKLNDSNLQLLNDLVKGAASHGIFFTITAINTAREELGRVGDYFTGIALLQDDRAAYKDVLGGSGTIMSDQADIKQTPGRGLTWYDEGNGPSIYELQCALYGSDVDTQRAAMVEQLSQQMRSAWKGRLPQSIVRIPKNLTMDAFQHILASSSTTVPTGFVEVGLRKSNGQAATINLDKHHALFITGANRSGRTNTIAAMGEMLRAKGAQIHYFGSAPLLNDHAAQHPGRVTIHPISTNDILQFMETELNPEMARRKSLHLAIPPKDIAAQTAFTQSLEPIAVLVDDVDAFIEALTTKADYLKWWAAACTLVAGRRLYLIFAASHKGFNRKRMSDLINVLVSIPYGIALGGMLAECNPWGITDSALRKLKLPLGEALLVQDQKIDHIVIPRIE